MSSYTDWVATGETVDVPLLRGERRIFVRSTGDGEQTILFLHGFPTSSWDWHKIEPLLTDRYRLVFFDFLGFGASEKPPNHRYDLLEQADLAEAVARHFQVRAARIVAHDYGTSVAQELLARHREGLLAFAPIDVTLLNGGIYPDLHRPVLVQKLLRSPFGPLASYAVSERTMSAALRAVFAPELAPTAAELAQHWQSISHNRGHRIGHRLIAYIDDRLAHQARWVTALETTDLPLRFVWGMRDPVSGAHVMARLHERFDGRAALVELEDVGHYPQLEAPRRVAAAIGSP
jgi:pimeloyl-ACP methyl ester carboxylesterase